MKKKYFVIPLLLVLISSCQTLENISPPEYKIQELNEENLNQLNGRYLNYQDTLFGEIESLPVPNRKNAFLTDRLFLFLPDDSYSDSTIVEMNFTSKRTCEVKAFKNDQLIFTKKLKGRIKNGYFLARPKFWILPFVPLVFGGNYERIRIGKVENGIIIDHKIYLWAMFFIAGGSQKGKVSAIYLLNDK